MVSCTEKDLSKYVLYVCNVFLLGFALVGIAFGIMILIGETSLQNDLKSTIACGSLLIVGGVALLSAIVLGTLGALKNSKTLLFIFWAPMIITLATTITERILMESATMSTQHTKQWLETALYNYNSSLVDREHWKDLQRNYKCCGINGYGDWKWNGISLPKSCCQKNPSAEAKDENESCKAFGEELSYVYENGCHKELVDAQNLFSLNSLFTEIAFYICWLTAVGAVCGILSDLSPSLFWLFI